MNGTEYLYTAIGRLDRETNGCGRSCPVIRLAGKLTWWICRKWSFGLP